MEPILSSVNEPDALKKRPVFFTTYVYVTTVFLSLQMFVTSGVFVKLIEQTCPVTVAVAVALTALAPPGPVVPDAVPVLTVVALIAAAFVNVWLAPGASGPHVPMEPILSSVNEPDALKKSPVFFTTYVYVTCVFPSLQIFVTSEDF